LLVFGVALYFVQLRANHHTQQAAAQAVARANAGLPSPAPATRKPSNQAVASYQVPAAYPRYLTIPSLQIHARVMAVGTTKSDAIGTPSNVYDTAWYKDSSLPGQPGATLIDGHVSSWTTHGVFYSLKSLQAGDQISLQLGSGATLQYKVVQTQIYSTQNITAATLLSPITANASGLNLITCTGDVIKGTNEFNQRVVVYATLT
jgi:LPXTG-site transpeptidase (sortase) family protein